MGMDAMQLETWTRGHGRTPTVGGTKAGEGLGMNPGE